MPTHGGDTEDDDRLIDAALHEALADLPGEDIPGPERGAGPDAVDYRWLGIGMRLGLERPGQARILLAMIAARGDAPAVRGGQDEGSTSLGGALATDDPQGPAAIPVASALLARAAALPSPALTSAGPGVAFGWVTRLEPGEILKLGHAVADMLATGSPPDVGRGFGIAWSAGVRVSRKELETMMDEFTELEITVGSILAGRDLRTGEPAAKPQGIAAWLGDWRPRTRPEEPQAAGAIERSGEAGRRGLVALWNVWMAMRYRTLIPRPTFDLLVHPWVTVVGPLPE